MALVPAPGSPAVPVVSDTERLPYTADEFYGAYLLAIVRDSEHGTLIFQNPDDFLEHITGHWLAFRVINETSKGSYISRINYLVHLASMDPPDDAKVPEDLPLFLPRDWRETAIALVAHPQWPVERVVTDNPEIIPPIGNTISYVDFKGIDVARYLIEQKVIQPDTPRANAVLAAMSNVPAVVHLSRPGTTRKSPMGLPTPDPMGPAAMDPDDDVADVADDVDESEKEVMPSIVEQGGVPVTFGFGAPSVMFDFGNGPAVLSTLVTPSAPKPAVPYTEEKKLHDKALRARAQGDNSAAPEPTDINSREIRRLRSVEVKFDQVSADLKSARSILQWINTPDSRRPKIPVPIWKYTDDLTIDQLVLRLQNVDIKDNQITVTAPTVHDLKEQARSKWLVGLAKGSRTPAPLGYLPDDDPVAVAILALRAESQRRIFTTEKSTIDQSIVDVATALNDLADIQKDFKEIQGDEQAVINVKHADVLKISRKLEDARRELQRCEVAMRAAHEDEKRASSAPARAKRAAATEKVDDLTGELSSAIQARTKAEEDAKFQISEASRIVKLYKKDLKDALARAERKAPIQIPLSSSSSVQRLAVLERAMANLGVFDLETFERKVASLSTSDQRLQELITVVQSNVPIVGNPAGAIQTAMRRSRILDSVGDLVGNHDLEGEGVITKIKDLVRDSKSYAELQMKMDAGDGVDGKETTTRRLTMKMEVLEAAKRNLSESVSESRSECNALRAQLRDAETHCKEEKKRLMDEIKDLQTRLRNEQKENKKIMDIIANSHLEDRKVLSDAIKEKRELQEELIKKERNLSELQMALDRAKTDIMVLDFEHRGGKDMDDNDDGDYSLKDDPVARASSVYSIEVALLKPMISKTRSALVRIQHALEFARSRIDVVATDTSSDNSSEAKRAQTIIGKMAELETSATLSLASLEKTNGELTASVATEAKKKRPTRTPKRESKFESGSQTVRDQAIAEEVKSIENLSKINAAFKNKARASVDVIRAIQDEISKLWGDEVEWSRSQNGSTAVLQALQYLAQEAFADNPSKLPPMPTIGLPLEIVLESTARRFPNDLTARVNHLLSVSKTSYQTPFQIAEWSATLITDHEVRLTVNERDDWYGNMLEALDKAKEAYLKQETEHFKEKQQLRVALTQRAEALSEFASVLIALEEMHRDFTDRARATSGAIPTRPTAASEISRQVLSIAQSQSINIGEALRSVWNPVLSKLQVIATSADIWRALPTAHDASVEPNRLAFYAAMGDPAWARLILALPAVKTRVLSRIDGPDKTFIPETGSIAQAIEAECRPYVRLIATIYRAWRLGKDLNSVTSEPGLIWMLRQFRRTQKVLNEKQFTVKSPSQTRGLVQWWRAQNYIDGSLTWEDACGVFYRPGRPWIESLAPMIYQPGWQAIRNLAWQKLHLQGQQAISTPVRVMRISLPAGPGAAPV